MAEVDDPSRIEFQWLKKRGLGGKNHNIQFYESFIYDGEKYTLYDSVYMHRDNVDEPDIGKLVRLWEDPQGHKKCRILWYFRPWEITYYLRGETFPKNELLLAAGEGVGLYNVNPLEAIAGKCKVVCTSRDSRNPQPSKEEIIGADFIFNRAFDVGSSKIVEKMDDKIAGVETKLLFNKVGKRPIPSTITPSVENSKSSKDVPKNKEGLKKRKLEREDTKAAKLPKPSPVQSTDERKRVDNKGPEAISIEERRSRWCEEQPWDQAMEDGYVNGSLVLLLNLDPSYTSDEVKELIKNALKENCSAKMVQRTAFSSPHFGQAFVNFSSKEVAGRVVVKLDRHCLVLPGGRPLVGRLASSAFKGKQSPFFGHFAIDKLKYQMQREKREAVSTSHCSQPNTIEHEMATEWALHQARVNLTWEAIHKQQGEELKRLRDRLKSV
ncbi:unnamed protein product [Linum tenue]|uniref:BAH domain-containing protein n=1 Tax=Linum tenue TaxID=586396 RepID=A0AAV0JID0_9ROSI|nr:unnamed protein product [Linum tenue]